MKKINDQIIHLLQQQSGIDVSMYDDTFLEKALQKRITTTHCSTVEEYFILLEQNKKECALFTDSLQICYSEFFRNPLTFSVLEQIIIPVIVSKKKTTGQKEIRIWSAACAAGQEPYSVAMIMEEYKNRSHSKFNYRIFATDQSESKVNEARSGNFSSETLNNLNIQRLRLWFHKQEHGKCQKKEYYAVKEELKQHIDFSVFDLFDERLSSPPLSIFGDFDLVICANLLFYYKPEYRKLILAKIKKSISKDGYLISGETERDILEKNNFSEIYAQSAIFKLIEKKH